MQELIGMPVPLVSVSLSVLLSPKRNNKTRVAERWAQSDLNVAMAKLSLDPTDSEHRLPEIWDIVGFQLLSKIKKAL